MKQTANFQLSQWETTDRIQMEDFNADNQKVDQALAALAAASLFHGNCSIYTTTYRGSGGSGSTAGQCRLTFPRAALFVMVGGSDRAGVCVGKGVMFLMTSGGVSPATTTWSEDGKTLNWYYMNSMDQLNGSGKTYTVTAIMAADA